MALEWPDSIDLLQTIVSTDWNSLALPPGSWSPLPRAQSQPQAQFHVQPRPQQAVANGQESIGLLGENEIIADEVSPPNGSHEAIQSLSNMVTRQVSCSSLGHEMAVRPPPLIGLSRKM